MSRQNKTIVSVVGVAVVLIVTTVLFLKKSNNAPTRRTLFQTTPASSTRAEVPKSVAVPGVNETGTAPGIAVPNVVIQAAPKIQASFRSFDINVNGGSFAPSTFIVHSGDTVRLSIMAVDKDYDFTQPDYGFKLALPQGKARILEFAGVSAGKFTFYCEKCGGPSKGPVGNFIIVPK